MDEQEARERVKPLGNVLRLEPGEAAALGAEVVSLYSVLAEPVGEPPVDFEELWLVESTLRLMGFTALADQIVRALGGRR